MSLYDYTKARELAMNDDIPFYALVMAAMRRADSMNAAKLERAFPHCWHELQARYDAPEGKLSEEDEERFS